MSDSPPAARRRATPALKGFGLALGVALAATVAGVLFDRLYRRKGDADRKPEPIANWENEGGAVPPDVQ